MRARSRPSVCAPICAAPPVCQGAGRRPGCGLSGEARARVRLSPLPVPNTGASSERRRRSCQPALTRAAHAPAHTCARACIRFEQAAPPQPRPTALRSPCVCAARWCMLPGPPCAPMAAATPATPRTRLLPCGATRARARPPFAQRGAPKRNRHLHVN
ncbi:MAG: hypothetical protein J3K34DRAFT_155038 [Monoraphidium minutum]|nr:MAG: hypothetical protein J3K34DRAFT_155038 [Monoraphidium minutum]